MKLWRNSGSIRLQEGQDAAPIRGQTILVAVDDVDVGILAQYLRNPVEGIRSEEVVVVEQCHELTCCELQRGIRVRADPFVLGQRHVPNA